jgi:putative colanic acid biosynthesis acetyltransferase WcaF
MTAAGRRSEQGLGARTQTRSLGDFSGVGYDKGRSKLVQALWFAVLNLVFRAWWCPKGLRPVLLRWFGATVGSGVLIRHHVRVLWPWKLTIGDDCWVGESAWILNLEPVVLGHDVCLSQGVFLCAGSHDRRSPSFEFDNGPIEIGDGAWIAATAVVLRGTRVGRNAVVGAGSIVTHDVADEALVPAGVRW